MAVKSYALTTRQRLIDFLELNNLTATQQTVLDRIIDSVTEYVENYCGRRFMETAYTNEEYDGDGSKYLIIGNYPISSSASFSLQERSSLQNENNWQTVDSEDYFVHYNRGTLEMLNGVFTNAPRHWRVSYTAGFDFDNVATFLSDTEAGDLEFAVWKLCATAWERRKGGLGVQAESIGDYSVTYAKEVFSSTEIKEILDKYARVSAFGIRN